MGKGIKLTGLPFAIIGTFKERVETFGQSEIVANTMLIPYSVSRYFTDTPTVKLLYFSMADPSTVPAATLQVTRLLQSRHRAESASTVSTLTALLAMADRSATRLISALL